MNTFLPYANFRESARVLDWRRLGKQRVEVLQMVRALLWETSGWYHHSCTQMWRLNVGSLIEYGLVICDEWVRRGNEDTVAVQLKARHRFSSELPSWFGCPRFHASHRSNLLRKDYAYYSSFGWTDSPSDPYFWPGADYAYLCSS